MKISSCFKDFTLYFTKQEKKMFKEKSNFDQTNFKKQHIEKRTLIVIIVFSLIPLVFLNTYSNFNLYKKYTEIENRLRNVNTELDLTKTKVVIITQILDNINFHALQQKNILSSLINKSRRKRYATEDEASLSLESKNEKLVERTFRSLKQEMFSLNDRLRMLLSNGTPRDGGQTSSIGLPGLTGKTGPPGVPGVNGRDGVNGAQGPNGPRGLQGPVGPEGPSGKNGLPGQNGVPGMHGYPGLKGEKGDPGRNGVQGLPGLPGREGSSGRPGRIGLKGEPGECANLETPFPNIKDSAERKHTELVYTIWGSSTCPYTSDMLYSGQLSTTILISADNSKYASDPLCLPVQSRSRRSKYQSRPGRSVDAASESKTREFKLNLRHEVNKNLSATEDHSSKEKITSFSKNKTITYTEYTPSRSTNPEVITESTAKLKPAPTQGITTEIFKTKETNNVINNFTPSYAELTSTRKYIPCAMCTVKDKNTKLMLPSRTQCPPSWTFEYQGYLMNYHHGTKQSHLLCVYDQALGVSPSSDAGIREIIAKYMNHVKVNCNSFSCPPWHRDLLKCVVCSK